MQHSFRIYLFLLLALIVAIVAIDATRKKPLNWEPTYALGDKIPLGLYVLDHEIDSLFGNSIHRCDSTPFEYIKYDKSKKTYLFIHNYAYIDDASINALLPLVEKGSTAFISSDGFPNFLLDTLHANTRYQYFASGNLWDKDTLHLSLTSRSYKERRYPLSPFFGKYAFEELDTTTTSALGYMHYADRLKYIGFVRIKFGKGEIFLHNQPAVFTNYSLLGNNNLSKYAAYSLSYLPKDQSIVWFVKGQMKKESEAKIDTALGVIFNYPALRAAWLIFLYGLVVFIFFRAKRMQRVIPITKPLQNTTLDFVQTIGNLYFQKGDATNITEKKIIYFLDKIRRKYYIDTHILDENFIRKLHLKSGKEIQLIEKIVWFIQWFKKNNQATEKELLRLNELMEGFWEK